MQEAEHWEGQSTLIYYIDLLASLSLEALTLLHSLHVWCAPGQGGWHERLQLEGTVGKRDAVLALHLQVVSRLRPLFQAQPPPRAVLSRRTRRWLHGVQMQLADGALLLEVRYMLGTLQQRLAGHSRYRRLQRTLTHSFPEAAAERLAGETCPICLDRMRVRFGG